MKLITADSQNMTVVVKSHTMAIVEGDRISKPYSGPIQIVMP